MGGHVGYESWLERDHLMLLDHDPAVTGIASQPFWLFWMTEAGKTLSHAPDYFARRAIGPAVVVDCRPLGKIRPRDAAKFVATERACSLMGWEYRLVGAPDPCGSGTCDGWPATGIRVTGCWRSRPGCGRRLPPRRH